MEGAASFDDVRAARYALGVLTFINLFNYLDRWVVAAVVESIKKSELHLTDTQIGLIPTGFIIIYTITSPLFGTFGDRARRPPLIAFGVAVWSLATALGGFARGFASLFIARSAVGVGEAAYGTIAPALLADFFPLERRGRVMAVFFMAIPVGSAAGYVLGGLVDQHFGWRAAFWIAGAPGLLLALLVLAVKDPPRGLHDKVDVGRASARPLLAYLDLLRNKRYLLTALGYGAYTFALGGLGFAGCRTSRRRRPSASSPARRDSSARSSADGWAIDSCAAANSHTSGSPASPRWLRRR
jgi:MFS family permease